jgi:hypothetical protein
MLLTRLWQEIVRSCYYAGQIALGDNDGRSSVAKTSSQASVFQLASEFQLLGPFQIGTRGMYFPHHHPHPNIMLIRS